MNRSVTKQLDPKEARLARVPLFARADFRSIRRLASVVDEVSVAPGRVLLREGEHHQQVYVVSSGSAAVHIGGQEVAQVESGAIVGELGFFLGGPATATVTAATEVELLVIAHNQFNDVLAETPDLLRAITDELARRLRATDAKLT